jgi:hypothetical protein
MGWAHKVPFVMRSGLIVILLALTTTSALAQASSTTNNDDSCDIGVTPAATLLVPYFEVDLAAKPGEGRTTVFSIINVTTLPQLARVTIWSDYAYPLLGFTVFLTGYDVQAIDVRDVLVRGVVPVNTGQPGSFSAPNYSNPNHRGTMATDCRTAKPSAGAALMDDVRSVLTIGWSTGASKITCPGPEGTQLQLGANHGATTAIGYATIDVVATCSAKLPSDPSYYTSDLLYDNVLIGDYTFIDPKGDKNGYATASPVVHIRAVPEGGGAGSDVATQLPQTFYGRFKPSVSDRRQPLPSVFAARFIEGGPTNFQTKMTIWRDAVTSAGASCAQYSSTANAPFVEIVRFDERENASIFSPQRTAASGAGMTLPPMARLASTSSAFPASLSTDVGGWFYLNLADGNRSRQSWVELTFFAEGRYGVQFPAAALGNGCSRAPVAGAKVGPIN